MEPLKEFGRTELSLDNCVIPNERLLNTPSAKDGMSHELETDLRIVGCEYIQSAGLLLKLPQVAMATAQILFQRFYYSKSFVKFSVQPLSMACIFLAAKIEEDCRRIRDVVNVFHFLRQKRSGRTIVPMEYMGEEYFKMKSTVVKYERFILKELGFCVHVKHPHKVIITYLQVLEMERNKQLVQTAWNFMNDGLKTNVFVRFSPETIACACIFLAARRLKIPLPQRPPWWLVFDTNYEDIEVIALEILALYTRPKRHLDKLEDSVAVLREKKHIEIKEVAIKKTDSTISSKNNSPTAGASPASSKPTGRGFSKSPAPSSPLTLPPAKPSRSPLLPIPSTAKVVQSEGSSQEASPVTKNGERRRARRVRSRSRSPTPPAKSRRSRNSSPVPVRPMSSASSRSPSPISPPTVYKPIHSPIKLSSSEDRSDHSSSPPHTDSPDAGQANGLPAQYRKDFEHDRRVRKERRKHRSEKRSRHRERVERSVSRERDRHRRHRRREKERDSYHDWYGSHAQDRIRERDRDRGRRVDGYRR